MNKAAFKCFLDVCQVLGAAAASAMTFAWLILRPHDAVCWRVAVVLWLLVLVVRSLYPGAACCRDDEAVPNEVTVTMSGMTPDTLDVRRACCRRTGPHRWEGA